MSQGAGWHHTCRRLALAVVLFALAGSAARADQMPAKSFKNQNIIVLPILFDPHFLDELKEVKLYVKEQPEQPWRLVNTVTPASKKFIYEADHDGEYWFTVVTVTKAGQPSVADVATQGPQAIVVLDRKLPDVRIKSVTNIPAGQCVHCQVTDEHLDASATRFEYQTKDKVWRALDAIPTNPGSNSAIETYCIPAQAATTGMVRISALDRCGNKAVKEFNLQDFEGVEPVAATPKQPTPPAPPTVTHEYHKTPGPGIGSTPIGDKVPSMPLPPEAPPQNTKPNPLLPPNGGAIEKANQPIQQVVHSAPAAGATHKIVNSARFTLHYQIDEVGSSGVGKVAVWITKDKGQHWDHLADDADCKSPVELTLPGEGVFGLSVVATNGLGFGGEAPAMGSQPDYWVEVDTTPPQAQLVTVDPLKGGQAGVVVITWTAADKNLLDEPIDLYFTTGTNGPWMPIAKGLKNSGTYRWEVPHLSNGKVYIRMTATDRGGNTSVSQTPEAVQLDDGTRPKVHIQGIGGYTEPASTPSFLKTGAE